MANASTSRPDFSNFINPTGLDSLINYLKTHSGATHFKIGVGSDKNHPGFDADALKKSLHDAWNNYVKLEASRHNVPQEIINRYTQAINWSESNLTVLAGNLKMQFDSLNSVLGIHGFEEDREVDPASRPSNDQLEEWQKALEQKKKNNVRLDHKYDSYELLKQVQNYHQYQLQLQALMLTAAKKSGMDVNNSVVLKAVEDASEMAIRQYGVQAITKGNVNPRVLLSVISNTSDPGLHALSTSKEVNQEMISFGNSINSKELASTTAHTMLFERKASDPKQIFSVYQKYFTPEQFGNIPPEQLEQYSLRAVHEYQRFSKTMSAEQAFFAAGAYALRRVKTHYKPGQLETPEAWKDYTTADGKTINGKTVTFQEHYFITNEAKRDAIREKKVETIVDAQGKIHPGKTLTLKERQQMISDFNKILAEELKIDRTILKSSRQRTRMLEGIVSIKVNGKPHKLNSLARRINAKLLERAKAQGIPLDQVVFVDEEDVLMSMVSGGDFQNLEAAFQDEVLDIDSIFDPSKSNTLNTGMRSLHNDFRTKQGEINGVLGELDDGDELKRIFDEGRQITPEQAESLQRSFRTIVRHPITALREKAGEVRKDIDNAKQTAKTIGNVVRHPVRSVKEVAGGKVAEVKMNYDDAQKVFKAARKYRETYYQIGQGSRLTLHSYSELGNGLAKPASWLVKGSLIGGFMRPKIAGAMWKAMSWRAAGTAATKAGTMTAGVAIKAGIGRGMIAGFKLFTKGGLSAIPVAGQILGAYFLADLTVSVIKKIPIVRTIAKPITWLWGKLKGAALGVGVGMAIGTAVGGPIGTIVGGIIGGLVGFGIQHFKKLAKAAAVVYALGKIMWANVMNFIIGQITAHAAALGNFMLGVGIMTGSPIAFVAAGILYAPQIAQGFQWLLGQMNSAVNALSNFISTFATSGITTTVVVAPLAGAGIAMFGSIIGVSVLIAVFSMPPFDQATRFLAGENGAPSEPCVNDSSEYPVLGMPTNGQITQVPFSAATGTHVGVSGNSIDIDGDIGDSVRSTIEGVVVPPQWEDGYGNMIKIHGSGVSSGAVVYYAHLSAIFVNIGDHVSVGDVIGEVGNTGNVVSAGIGDGAHLHYELRPTSGSHQFNLMCTIDF